MSVRAQSYVDRHTGRVKQEPIYAHRFLDWAYNSSVGWLLTNLLFSRKIISQLYGWANKRRWSRRKISTFIESLDVNMDESVRSAREFTSFNDFIVREIDLSKRPIAPDPGVCVAPADGRVLAYQAIKENTFFTVKRSRFNLQSLLCDDHLVLQYTNGSLLIVRLYLTDYHHYHFPDSGVPGETLSVPGKYYAVTPYSRRRPVPFFAENHRMLTRFESDNFGKIMMIEVGAFTVGSIQQRFQPGTRVHKGERKGFFELGGSVVVLIFRRGAIQLDRDLCKNTRSGLETYLRLGESIGRVPD